ncbi:MULTISPECIES: FAD-binding oxidoreductase [Anaerolinea]|uniref:NAD(P)/FAD-dependent oxidoreductase n=1 Tax=Anaerolinea TaxID=233189 RepID=UPI00262A0B59|nr:FAD-binding oxidoreductase [Anaerolinea thermophila]
MSDYPQSYDVIVIGAGSVGTPAALSLAQAGLKVLVLDAMPSAGQGSNKHAIGGIRATHSDPAKIRLCLRSIEIFSTWKEVYGDDIEWYKGGYVFVAYREQEEQTLKTLLQKQQAYGLNISWLDSGDLRKLIPHLNPEGLIGGTYSPNDGSASPLLSIHAFYKQARNYGAEFHFNEPVTEIIVRSGKIQGVKTSKGMYSTPVVIHASGAWAKSLMNPIGIEIPVQPDSHEAAITEPVQRMFDPMIVDIRPAQGSANFYFYQHKTGQILFCITPSPNIWGFDIRETSAFLPMVSKRMVEVMPSLRHIRIRRTWRGLYPMTPDGFPIVGWSREAEGLLLAVGMCGQGYMLGPGLGELLTRMVTNTLSPGDEEILSILSPYREFVGQEKLK